MNDIVKNYELSFDQELIVTAVSMDEEALKLTFNNGRAVRLTDEGHCCCELRHMSTDDDIQSLIGRRLISVKEKEGSSYEDNGDVHEIVFVEIQTDAGFVTIVNHNEHNGYYSGFSMCFTEVAP